MVDIQTILASINQRRANLREIGKVNKDAVFAVLAANSFTRVSVTFDGEGDSGQIDNIVGYAGEVPTGLPEGTLALQNVGWSDHQTVTEEKSLRDAIEHLCYDFLEQEHGGWENNDGAFGEFTLNVADRTVALEFNGRYTDVHTSTHTF